MKRQILLGLTALLLAACSGEDAVNVTATATKQLPGEKELNTVTDYSGYVKEFENNKVVREIPPNGEWQYSYTYNNDGQLSGLTMTNDQGQLGFERVVSYDNDGRIVSKNETTYYLYDDRTITENTTYTYNNDSTVTVAIGNSLEGNQARTYYFDPAGKLVKISTNGITQQEILYNGNNISAIGNISYSYDDTTPVKGQFLNIYTNQFNTYSNFVLYNGYLVPNAVSDKFLIGADGPYGSDDYTHTYEFDEDGYPITVTTINPQSEGQSTITITYK